MMKPFIEKYKTELLVVLLVFVLLFAIYYYLVSPKRAEVETLRNSEVALQNEVLLIRSEVDAKKETEPEQNGTNHLMVKKLPYDRDVTRLLINFEEIQFITGTKIVKVDFNAYDMLVSEWNANEQVTSNVDADLAEVLKTQEGNQQAILDAQSVLSGEQNEEHDEASTETNHFVTTITRESLPENLKLLTVALEIEAKSGDAILHFIEELERLERVVHVDTIEFQLPGEVYDIRPENEIINVEVQITTFYYELGD